MLIGRHLAYVVAFIFMWGFPGLHQALDPESQRLDLSVLDAVVVSTQSLVLVLIRFGLRLPGCSKFMKFMLCHPRDAVRDARRKLPRSSTESGLQLASSRVMTPPQLADAAPTGVCKPVPLHSTTAKTPLLSRVGTTGLWCCAGAGAAALRIDGGCVGHLCCRLPPPWRQR
jgi:hypothetical protein